MWDFLSEILSVNLQIHRKDYSDCRATRRQSITVTTIASQMSAIWKFILVFHSNQKTMAKQMQWNTLVYSPSLQRKEKTLAGVFCKSLSKLYSCEYVFRDECVWYTHIYIYITYIQYMNLFTRNTLINPEINTDSSLHPGY